MTLDLWDYRRRVADIYAAARAGGAGEQTWDRWRTDRDRLFATHSETPLDDPGTFETLPYFDYDPAWRALGKFTGLKGESRLIGHSGDGETRFRAIGTVSFEVGEHHGELMVLWLDSYGGGVFLPFRDETNTGSTYGGGRYLLDTAKGADLGHGSAEIVLDFNYSYHPSCVHSDRWSCPLAPPENRLAFPIAAGERLSAAPAAR